MDKNVPDTLDEAVNVIAKNAKMIHECRLEPDKCFCFKSRINFLLGLIEKGEYKVGLKNI